MAQAQNPATSTYTGVAFVAAFLIAVVIALGAAGMAFVRVDLGAGQPLAPVSEVTDGWLPAISAANAAKRDALAAEATDGWAARYRIAAPAANEVTDGWATRLLTD